VVSKHNRLLAAVVLAICTFGTLGCPGRTTIADINRDPGHYAGKQIKIAGKVTDAFGALGNGVFQIDDGTGTMWVFSQNFGVPSNGAKVAVTGVISQGFSFGGRSFATIMKETERRH